MNTQPISPYLFFGGRCEEALEFYRSTLGAELDMLMRYRESPEPMSPGMLAPGWEDKVMHASFHLSGSIIMASDGCDGDSCFQGFALSLTLPDADEAHRVFAALSEAGEVRMPIAKTFWSPCFGMLTDRFGLGWMITVPA